MNIEEKEDNNSLIILLNGGLGNQLFMLFAGISKAIDENRDYKICLLYNKRTYYFENFLNHLYFKLVCNIDFDNIDKNIIYNETESNYVPIPDNMKIINGFFQSDKYFKHNFHLIKEELRIDYYRNQYKLNLKSIAIHFRFGDYLELTHYHRILSFVYYLKAIKYLQEHLSDFDEYTFVIFYEKSNENIVDSYISQFNHNLQKPLNYIKIHDRYPNNNSDYIEFFYMSSCNHMIIANSTFSWFSAYINDTPNKIIIYPSTTKWFAEKIEKNLSDLIPESWIEIDY